EPWTTFDCTTMQYFGRCRPFHLRHYPRGGRGSFGSALRALFVWLDHRRMQRVLRNVDGIIGVSAGILTLFPERLAPTSRRRVVYTLPPSGARPSLAEAARVRERLGISAGPLVLYAGKQSLGKGTHVFIDALEAIRAAVPGVHFAFAGKSEMALPPSS